MSDLLDILMKDPTVKEEMVLRAKKAIKDLVFTKQDETKIKAVIINTIVEACDSDDCIYEIQNLITKEMKKIIVNKFKE